MRPSTVVAALMIVASSVLNAQERKPQTPVFGSEVQIVNLSVSVTKNNKYIAGLKAERFVVSENGEAQTITTFQEEDARRLKVAILFDASPSMHAAFRDARAAAAGFIDTLRPGDQASIKVFSSIVTTIQDFTEDHALLKKALLRIEQGQTTRLYEAVREVMQEFGPMDIDQPSRQVVILITDGEDTGSNGTDQDALENADNSGVTVYSIMLPTPDKSTAHKDAAEQASEFVTQLSRRTGGMSWGIIGKLDTRLAYKIIAQELKTQYRIGYTPTHQKDPGPDRSVQVGVRGWDNYTLRYRTDYHIPKPAR